jgi:hypothetical protein
MTHPFTLVAEYNSLVAEHDEYTKHLNEIESDLAFARSALRKLVKVNKKYTSFTQLEFEGRIVRVSYNSYGDAKITENKKELKTKRIRPSINDLRLDLALGRI